MTNDPASLAREFAPTGVLRMGVNFGNPVVVQKDAAGGPPHGVGPDLARDPARAGDIEFSAPYMLIEGTYMVPRESPLRTVDDVDRDGIRVAVGDKSAYDLYLSRTLRHATLVKTPSSAAAIERFRAEALDAVAGVRQPLATAAKNDPAYRVMETSFMAIGQASGVPRGRPQAAAYLHRFIEEAKSNGFVARSLAASGQSASVAPPEGGSPR